MNFIKKHILSILALVLLVAVLLGLSMGAYHISIATILDNIKYAIIGNEHADSIAYNVFWYIRMPRVLMAVLIGATLAVAGVGFQGLFRNPLADAGLIGVGSGATIMAMCAIVLGNTVLINFQSVLGQYFLNIAAFSGALASIFLVYRLSRSHGKTQIAIMLLAGIALNAIVGAFSGMITLAAKDEQLRTITFWSLGSLGGSTWMNVTSLLPFAAVTLILMPFFGKSLNALSLGEQDAQSMGIPIERVKNIIMIVCAIGVGACVAMAGMIGFIGLVIPHIFRMLLGPDHKKLIIVSSFGGAILLVLSDLISRTILSPVEIPIGIITSLIGGPFFMYLLLKERYSPETGLHYYEEYERINNEEVANYLVYKYIKNLDYCIIKVGFLTNEYLETLYQKGKIISRKAIMYLKEY